jgi:DNA-binding NarL/FixJ family response regulator
MPQELQLKFAIADDHKIFRDGIKMALNGRPHLKCRWERVNA